VDETSFIPFEQEDFGPENARREERHYEILDALFNYLIADKSLHANAKKTTGNSISFRIRSIHPR
jgi:hypothetical protein